MTKNDPDDNDEPDIDDLLEDTSDKSPFIAGVNELLPELTPNWVGKTLLLTGVFICTIAIIIALLTSLPSIYPLGPQDQANPVNKIENTTQNASTQVSERVLTDAVITNSSNGTTLRVTRGNTTVNVSLALVKIPAPHPQDTRPSRFGLNNTTTTRQCLADVGRNATNQLDSLTGQTATVIINDSSGTTHSGIVTINNSTVSYTLVRDGLAIPKNTTESSTTQSPVAKAKNDSRGVWACN